VINSPLAGTVESLAVQADGWVTQGQTLCILGGAAAETAIQQLQAQVVNDETQLQQDQQTEQQLTVTSDLAGTVGQLYVQTGEHVNEGEPIGTVYNSSSMTLTINVDELQVANVQPGQQVIITTPGLPGKTFSGQVTNLDTMGTNSGGAGGLATFGVNIAVNAAQGLLPGMTADAQIVVQTVPDAVLVPVEAIVQQGTQAEVEVLQNGQPSVVPVSVGLVNDQYAQITSGLQAGQTVITGVAGASALIGQTEQSSSATSGGGGQTTATGVGPFGGGPAVPSIKPAVAAGRG